MNKDEAREQRIEIATRLMEAWLKGHGTKDQSFTDEEKARNFLQVAIAIQTEA